MPKVGHEAGLRKIGEYLAEVSRLRELKHVQGEHQREVLNQKIIAFIRNAFDDPQETIKEYDSHVNIHFAIAGKQKTSQEKEIDYQRNLSNMETMLQAYHEELEMVKHNNVSKNQISYDPKKVFIVYGHNSDAKWELVRMVEKEFGLEAIVLEEQADMGRTIIEKFENVAELPGYAFVLLTPDDVGGENMDGIEMDISKIGNKRLKDLNINFKPRARQNVILELGYFYARLHRERVCCLYKEGVEIPSDISGVIYKKFTKSIREMEGDIRRELRAVGYGL